MYNTEQKARFIKEYSTKLSVRDAARKLFDLLEPYETQWGADLCTVDLATLQPVFDRIAGVRESSRLAPRTILRKYVEWCVRNGIPETTDAVMNLDSAGLGNLRNQMLKNPRHLQAFLDVICEPESEQTSDNNIRAYYWLAYAGLDAEEIFRVTVGEVDFERMLVHHDGKDYPIYREALPALRNCATLNAFHYKHPNYSAGVDVWKDRIPGAVLLRGIRSVPNVAIMRVELSKRLKKAQEAGKTELKLSYYRIWLSGVFYRMLEDELAGMPVDFSSVVDDKLGDFQYKVPEHGNTQEYKRKKVAENYQNDYERWKQTLL